MTIRIMTGDCRTIMPLKGPFDCIIADPPYGDTSLAWDRRVDGWLQVARDCLKPTGSLWVFGSMRSFLDTGPLFRAAGWRYAQDIVWEKHNGSAFHADRFKRVHEHVAQFYRDDAQWSDVWNEVQTTPDAVSRTVRARRKPSHLGNIGEEAHLSGYVSHDGGPRIMRSVIAIPSCHGHAIHPTEKPVDLMTILVRTSCPPRGLVGDFFAGSASVAEACASLGRDYVGCEIDPDMADKARRRSLVVLAGQQECVA